MNRQKSWVRRLVLASASAAVLWGVADQWLVDASAVTGDDEGKQLATRSSPIAITSDNKFVWSVNPDNDSVSVFRVAKDANKKVAEIPVGEEPWCVAVTPPEQEGKVYVTNMVSGTVSVINARREK
jgi:YVTN family beta-propeller protein